MYKIYCDETWTAGYVGKKEYFVFYGVVVDETAENGIIQEIDKFKRDRGLYKDDKAIEIKWVKVEEEWKSAKKSNRPNRYNEFMNIFITSLKSKKLSFGYMFLEKKEYERVEQEFLVKQPDNKHNFFFMMYFQFLYQVFIRHHIKRNPCQIFIDKHDMGAKGQSYDINKLKDVLNWRSHNDLYSNLQMVLSPEFKKQVSGSVQIVDLADSKCEPLIQMADLCAGCVRYILENDILPPGQANQPSFFDNPDDSLKNYDCGKAELAKYFYMGLRSIEGYEDIDLAKTSYHYRFCIFPFKFIRAT